jgi:hypothetical protein
MGDEKITETPQTKTEGEKPRTVFVKSTLKTSPDGGNKTALFEAHPDHPGGQAHVAGPAPVEVALTPEVTAAIRDGRLAEVDKSERDAYDREQQKKADAALKEGRCPSCGAVLPTKGK